MRKIIGLRFYNINFKKLYFKNNIKNIAKIQKEQESSGHRCFATSQFYLFNSGKVIAIHKNMTEEEKNLVTMNKEKRAKKLGAKN